MKATIEATDRKEAEAIRNGLADPTMRATLVIVGALTPLPAKVRQRVLQFVRDQFEEGQQ